MLYEHHFSLVTDHKSIGSNFGSKKAIPVYAANRLHRWVFMLLYYDFAINYHNKFNYADALSRLMSAHCKPPADTALSIEIEIVSLLTTSVKAVVTSQIVQEATVSDPLLQKVMHYHPTK